MSDNGNALKRNRSSQSRASAKKIIALQREQQALELRIGGASYRQIGQALQIEPSTAMRAVFRGLDKIREEVRENASQYVQLQLERLDKMLLAVWPSVTKGSYGAIDRALRIEERRARLLGLDAAEEALVDWRRRLEEQDIPASAVFEKLVKYIMDARSAS